MERTLAIGDVHGCVDELRDLLRVSLYRPGTDSLVFVGDYVDRGPDPAGVIDLIRSLQRASPGRVHACQGNHDEKMGRWFLRVEQEHQSGTPNKMQPPTPERLDQWGELTRDDVAWVRALPVMIHPLADWIAVHAGFEGVPREAQREDRLMRVRWLNPETGAMVPLKRGRFEGRFQQPPGTIHWSERWAGPENVVYGHAVHSLTTPRVDRLPGGIECWGIDTGACYGGRLTALVLETREIIQVNARATYAKWEEEFSD